MELYHYTITLTLSSIWNLSPYVPKITSFHLEFLHHSLCLWRFHIFLKWITMQIISVDYIALLDHIVIYQLMILWASHFYYTKQELSILDRNRNKSYLVRILKSYLDFIFWKVLFEQVFIMQWMMDNVEKHNTEIIQ